MSKPEQKIITIGLGILIPLVSFILCWWLSASLVILKIIRLPEYFIIICAVTGLLTGILLDLIYLKKITNAVYSVNGLYLIPVYLFCSLIAVAALMGLPFINIILGMTAGVYTGRKYLYAQHERQRFYVMAGKTAYFTAFVTGIEALLIGLMALKDLSVFTFLQSFFHITPVISNRFIDILLVILLSALLVLIQFRLTLFAAKSAFIRRPAVAGK